MKLLTVHMLIRISLTFFVFTVSNTDAADISFIFVKGANPNPAKFATYYFNTIKIEGPIRYGDYDHLVAEAIKHRDKLSQGYINIILNSPGGDIVEAMRIADFSRQMLAGATIHEECYSACFLIWVGVVERGVAFSNPGIHRPYFEKRYFAGLSAEKARDKHNALLKVVRSYLEDNNIPNYLIERMFALPSSELYILTAQDILTVGRRPPWYEELLIARCGLDKKLERQPNPNWPYVESYSSKIGACAESFAVADRQGFLERLSKQRHANKIKK